MKYKYVIGGVANDFYMASYKDIMLNDAAEYHKEFLDTSSEIIRKFFGVHFGRVNNSISLPFKSFWNPWILRPRNLTEKKICFILFSNYTKFIDTGLFDYWRRKYPGCKLVLFFQDLVKTNKYKHPEKLKDIFDLVLSFDQEDCKQYNFEYYPLVYSKVSVEDDENIDESDLYFVGKAKDRLNDIIDIFEKCDSAGIKCDFHIVGVDPDLQVHTDKINYCSQMAYRENLKRIKKTKCMLEIMQQGGHGYTLRYCEAIAMGKRLLTNNPEIIHAPFYNADFISIFRSAQDCDTSFIVDGPNNVDYNFLEELSPNKLLEYIDNKI